MKEFKGRIVAPGTVTAEAVVSHSGFNTLASLQGALQFGDKKATCGDQNNPDLHGKELAGKALCLPMTIGSTTGICTSGSHTEAKMEPAAASESMGWENSIQAG